MSGKNKRQKEYLIYLILLISIALRVAKLMIDPLLMRDSSKYLIQIDKWVQYNDYKAIIEINQDAVPPLPLWIVKELMIFGFNSEITGRAFNIFISSFIPIICMILAYKLFRNYKVSAIALCLSLIHPQIIKFSIQPLRDNLGLLLAGLYLIFIVDAIKTQKREWWIKAGIICAVDVFCRYESVEFIAITTIILVVLHFFERVPAKKCIGLFALFLISFITTCSAIYMVGDFDLGFISKIGYSMSENG